jgi:hypothetical protein
VTAKKVRFTELATAGVDRLFPEEWRRASAIQSIILALAFDPTKHMRPCLGFRDRNFMVRNFVAGVEIRVLFELVDEITVWSVTRPANLR